MAGIDITRGPLAAVSYLDEGRFVIVRYRILSRRPIIGEEARVGWEGGGGGDRQLKTVWVVSPQTTAVKFF